MMKPKRDHFQGSTVFKNGENQQLSFSEFSMHIHVHTVIIAKAITGTKGSYNLILNTVPRVCHSNSIYLLLKKRSYPPPSSYVTKLRIII